MSFLHWLHLFIISPLFSSSILGIYRPDVLIFQCHIFLPFHIVHGTLKARILKWFYLLHYIYYCGQESLRRKLLSHVQLFVTPWTVAYEVPPSVEFSRQEYWSGLPSPSPGDLPEPGIKPGSLALQADSFTVRATRETLKNWSSPHSQQESKMQYWGAVSKMTEWSLFISQANHSISQ